MGPSSWEPLCHDIGPLWVHTGLRDACKIRVLLPLLSFCTYVFQEWLWMWSPHTILEASENLRRATFHLSKLHHSLTVWVTSAESCLHIDRQTNAFQPCQTLGSALRTVHIPQVGEPCTGLVIQSVLQSTALSLEPFGMAYAPLLNGLAPL